MRTTNTRLSRILSYQHLYSLNGRPTTCNTTFTSKVLIISSASCFFENDTFMQKRHSSKVKQAQAS